MIRTEKRDLSPTVAFVTPSYRLDLERCALLNRSLEACAPAFEHWIVVDRGDVPLFRHLRSSRTTVVPKEEVLPVWVRRLDTLKLGLRSNVWVHAGGRPIRGWLLQQLVKLAVTECLSTDVVVHADSDVVFLRPFSVPTIVDGRGRTRLYARPDYVDDSLPHHLRWHRSAERLLGIDAADVPMPDFVSSLVPWRRENGVALLRHIEQTTGRHWLRALAAAWDVSEYTLYGRFALDVLAEDANQFVSTAPLCADYYKHVPLTAPELTTFLGRIDGDSIAVSLTSKAGMQPEDYVEVLERAWAVPVARRADVAERAAAPRLQARGSTTRPGRRSGRGAPARGTGTARHGAHRRDAGRPSRVPTRSGIAAAVGALLVLMMVLLEAGLD